MESRPLCNVGQWWWQRLKVFYEMSATHQLDPLQNDLPQKYEAGNSWKFNSTKWFGYPSFQLQVKIIDCLQNDGTRFFSTKGLDFYDLHGSRLLSFIQKTVPKTISSEPESYQMVEDMATSILLVPTMSSHRWDWSWRLQSILDLLLLRGSRSPAIKLVPRQRVCEWKIWDILLMCHTFGLTMFNIRSPCFTRINVLINSDWQLLTKSWFLSRG